MVEGRSLGTVVFNVLNYLFLTILTLACILPLIHIVAVSFSNKVASETAAVGLWPVGFNTFNYARTMGTPAFIKSFEVSVLRVFAGTALNLVITVMTAYPLSLRTQFRGKEGFKWFLVFAMMFSGGLIPWYLVLKALGLVNQIAGLILPGMVNVFFVLVTINFFRSLPVEFSEAAEIDGATHWDILFKVYLPLCLPMLAALALFFAVGHWNSWFDGLVIMRDPNKFPLQTYLQASIVGMMNTMAGVVGDPKIRMFLSERSWRASEIVLASIPVLAVYPFLQRYFVTMRMGGIKG